MKLEMKSKDEKHQVLDHGHIEEFSRDLQPPILSLDFNGVDAL